MKIVLIFIAAFVAGFAGSLYPGPVKLSVVQSVIQQSLRAGLWASVGASLPEVVGSILAIKGVHWLQDVPDIFVWFQWAIIPALLIMGYFTLRKKETKLQEEKVEPVTAPRKAFTKALVLNLFNPQLVAFWLVVAVWFNSKPGLSLDSLFQQGAFIVGGAMGAFGINFIYAKLTYINRERILHIIKPQTIQLLTGWGFILLGIWQAVQTFR